MGRREIGRELRTAEILCWTKSYKSKRKTASSISYRQSKHGIWNWEHGKHMLTHKDNDW